MNSFSVSFLPVSRTFSALTTMTKSPASRCGVYTGLFLPRKMIGNLRGQPAEHGAVGVNHVPFPLVQIYFGQMCFHCYPNKRERESIRRTDEVNKLFDGKVACRRRPIP